jgi:hypothetical protein
MNKQYCYCSRGGSVLNIALRSARTGCVQCGAAPRALFWFHFASPNASKIDGVSCRRSTDGGIYIISSPPTARSNTEGLAKVLQSGRR